MHKSLLVPVVQYIIRLNWRKIYDEEELYTKLACTDRLSFCQVSNFDFVRVSLVLRVESTLSTKSFDDMLTRHLRVIAMLSKLLRTEFQITVNFLNNRKAYVAVKLLDALGSVRFVATIIWKAIADLLVADTAIQFLKQKLSGRVAVAEKL